MRDAVPRDFPGRAGLRRAGSTETRKGLSLLRSLVVEGKVVHEDRPHLAHQVEEARVRPVEGGLGLITGPRSRSVAGGVVGVVVCAEAAGGATGCLTRVAVVLAFTSDHVVLWITGAASVMPSGLVVERSLIPGSPSSFDAVPNDNDPADDAAGHGWPCRRRARRSARRRVGVGGDAVAVAAQS